MFFYTSLLQKLLIDVVRKCTREYLDILPKESSNGSIDIDLVEGFITRALQYHYQKHNGNIEPHNVKARKSEDELKQKQ